MGRALHLSVSAPLSHEDPLPQLISRLQAGQGGLDDLPALAQVYGTRRLPARPARPGAVGTREAQGLFGAIGRG